MLLKEAQRSLYKKHKTVSKRERQRSEKGMRIGVKEKEERESVEEKGVQKGKRGEMQKRICIKSTLNLMVYLYL